MSQPLLPKFKEPEDARFWIYIQPNNKEPEPNFGDAIPVPDWIWEPLGTQLEYDEDGYVIIPPKIRALGTRNSFQDT